MRGRMAVIGDGDSVLIFSAAGITPFSVSNGFDAEELIKKLAKSYEIIFITDIIAKECEETISKYASAPYPIIIPIPSKDGSNGYGDARIKAAMEKALGIDILYNAQNDEQEGQ